MIFGDIYWFYSLILFAVLFPIIMFIGKKVHQRKLQTFVGSELVDRLVENGNSKVAVIRFSLWFIGIFFIVASLARPLLTEKEGNITKKGCDFMIAIDVSKSMLARDFKPTKNRLEAVKNEIRNYLKDAEGDRIGLIAFAGEARMISPMTFNKKTIELMLDHLSPKTIWRSGSDLAKPIEIANKFLGKKEVASRVLVIFSDGEQHDTDPSFAARAAKSEGNLTVFTIGVGSQDGAKVPIETIDKAGNVVKTEYLKNVNDEEVISVLDESRLRDVARITNGAYVRMKPRNPDSTTDSTFKRLYDTQIQPLAQSLRVAKVVSKEDVYQYPLFVAIMLLLMEMLVAYFVKGKAKKLPQQLVVLCLCILPFVTAHAEESVIGIRYAEKPVIVDGHGGEWKQVQSLPLPYMKKEKSALKLLWHEKGLYGLLEIRKNKELMIRKREPWKGDSLELFIEKDNALNQNFEANDLETEQFIFFPDTVDTSGDSFVQIPRGKHVRGTVRPDGQNIKCKYSTKKNRYSLEFFISAEYMKPAIMAGRTTMTVHFCVNDDGHPIQQFAVDKNVADNSKKPIAWQTVTLFASQQEIANRIEEKEAQPESFAVMEEESVAVKVLTIEEQNDRLDIAEAYLEDGQIEEAVFYLGDFIDEYPDNPYALYNYGIALYRKGDYISAESIWNRAATVSESPVVGEALFQLGNACYRQASLLPNNRKNWNAVIALLRRGLDYHNEIDESFSVQIQERVVNNSLIMVTSIAQIMSKRGNAYLSEAHTILEAAKLPENKSWQVKDLLKDLEKVSGQAEGDFKDLETFILENPSLAEEFQPQVESGLARINRIMVFSLLSNARMTVKEVEESGSTQNNKWTIKMYQTAISYYEQLLRMYPDHAEALAELATVQQSICNTYVKESNIELRMATDVVQEDIKERKMKARMQELLSQTGRAEMKERDSIQSKLNYMERSYPSSDPEDAMKHWINAIANIKTALSFSKEDSVAQNLLKKTEDDLFEGRKRYAQRYIDQASAMVVENDEEADVRVSLQEKAVRSIEQAANSRPSVAEELSAYLQGIQKTLARYYYGRGQIYIELAKEKKKTHLDRAVAYLQKATQDFSKAYTKDPSFEMAKKARTDNDTIQYAWRKELSDRIAQELAAQAVEEDDDFSDVSFDEDKLRDLTLQEEEDPMAGYGENSNLPEPIHNW